MDTKTLESIIGEKLAALVREKYPITDKTVIVELVAERPGYYQDHFDIPYRYLREGGYIHPLPRFHNVRDGLHIHGKLSEYVPVGAFELWAEGKNEHGDLYNWHYLAYVPERDMLFIA